jgi:hypothetical protein
MLSKVKEDL